MSENLQLPSPAQQPADSDPWVNVGAEDFEPARAESSGADPWANVTAEQFEPVQVVDTGYYEFPDGTRMLEGEMGRFASGRDPVSNWRNESGRRDTNTVDPWESVGAEDFEDLNIDDRSKWEKFTGYHPSFFGRHSERSIGDLLKEGLRDAAIGTLIRIGVGTAGVYGIPLAVIAGAGVKGIPEYYRRTHETWARLQAEHGGNLGKGDRLKGFFNPDNKTSIALAIGKGAAFGLIGNEVGSALSQLPQLGIVKTLSEALGGKLEGVVGAVKGVLPDVSIKQPFEVSEKPEAQTKASGTGAKTGIYSPEAWKLQFEEGTLGAGPAFIEPGKYSPEIRIPDNAQEWIKDASNLKGDYATAIQAEVGKYHIEYIDKAVDKLLEDQGRTTANLSPYTLEGLRNHMLHILEDQGNRAFDSGLNEAVKDNISLDRMKELGHNSYFEYLNTKGMEDLVNGGDNFLKVDNDIRNLNATLAGLEGVGVQSYGYNLLPGETLTRFIEGSEKPEQLGASILANINTLMVQWKVVYPGLAFPAYPGEILYLIEKAKTDPSAYERLLWVYKIVKMVGVGFYTTEFRLADGRIIDIKDNPEFVLRILRRLK